MDQQQIIELFNTFKRNRKQYCQVCLSEEVAFKEFGDSYFCLNCVDCDYDYCEYKECIKCDKKNTYGFMYNKDMDMYDYHRLCKECFINEINGFIEPCTIKPAKR